MEVLDNPKNFGIEARSQRGFEKGDMLIILIMESTTIVFSIITFELVLIPMFFHFDSLKKIRYRSSQSKFFTTIIVVIVTTIRGVKSSHERQLMIVDGEGQFD
jgi:hypothetical protein